MGPDRQPEGRAQWLLWIILLASACGLLAFVIRNVWQAGRPGQPGQPITRATEAQAPRLTDQPVEEFQPRSTDGYVGSARCAECHGEIAKSFSTHPMAQSARPIDASTISPEQLVATRVPGRTRVLDVEQRDDKLIHHERMYDATGREIYDLAVSMLYEVGSGQRAKAYVHQRGDALFMSPLNWYSNAQKWDLAPNYEPDDERRFDRRVTDECLSCHTGRLNPTGRGVNRYGKPVAHELSIGCENCHGPGADHIEFRELKLGGKDPIVQPADLEPERRESVCNQCHLQVAVRLPRPGRSHLDFRPGDHLEEIWTLLDTHVDVSQDGRTRSVNHVQQMRASRCFQASEGRMGCISCHDPHRVPAPAERDQFYRQKCATCHQSDDCTAPVADRQAQSESCIACHLPTRDSANISHVTQTDHRILRHGNLEPSAVDSPEELKLLMSPDFPLSAYEQQRALALGAWIYLSKADRTPPPMLGKSLDDVLKVRPNDPEVLLAVGSVAWQHQLTERAHKYFTAGIKLPASEEEALWGLLNLEYQDHNWLTALQHAERLSELDVGAAKVYAVKADILRQLRRTGDGVQAARAALRYHPSLLPVREWLVTAYKVIGDQRAAEQEERTLRRLRSARIPTAPKSP